MSVKVIDKEYFYSFISEDGCSLDKWLGIHIRPVIIDFFAEWCPPCKALSPILDELSLEYLDKVDIYKVNIDYEEHLTSIFNVKMVPTLLFAKPDFTKPILMSGVIGKEELRTKIIDLLLN